MRSSDIVGRLCETATRVRNSGEWGELADVLVDAAAEIELLRFAIRRIAQQDATLSVCEGAVTVQVDGTLTEAEQLAVAWAAREADEWDEEETPEVYAHAEVLAGLFRRLT